MRSSCAIRSAKITWHSGLICAPGFLLCSIATYARAPSALRFLNSAAFLFPQVEKKNAILASSCGETRPIRLTGARKRSGDLIFSRTRVIGFGGQLSASCARELNALGPIFSAELHADLALEAQKSAKTFREIERFPTITRDIAMIVPEKLPHAEILRTIEEPREPLLESVELFDLFESPLAFEQVKQLNALEQRFSW